MLDPPRKPLALLMLFVSLSLSGAACGGNSEEPAPTPEADMSSSEDMSAGATDMEDATPAELRDTDGDGLTDAQELRGWHSVVEGSNGRTTHHFTSDPEVADSDRDGLTDHQEFVAKTDPWSKDTDFDTLSDYDEVIRWKTNPTSIDSDGDARAPDSGPDSALNPSLFDAAELKLVEDPTRPGIMIASSTATNPTNSDTDSDGLSDYEELRDANRNPLIAELPQVSIRPDPDSDIGIFLNVIDTITNEKTQELTKGRGTLEAASVKAHAEFSFEVAVWATAYAEVIGRVKAGAALQAASVEGEEKIGFIAGASAKAGFSYGLDADYTRGLRRFGELVKAETETTNRAISGGTITMAIEFTNTSSLPFSIRRPTVNTFYNRTRGEYLRRGFYPLATLQPVNPELEYTLKPGESVSIVMEDRDIDGGRTLEFLQGSASLQATAINFEIVDENARSYDFVQERARLQSAEIQFDFGDGRVETHRIAATVQRSLTGEVQGISLTDAFDLIGIDWDVRPDAPRLVRIEQYDTLIHEGDAPDLQAMGLDKPGYRYTKGPGDRLMHTGWIAILYRNGELIDIGVDIRAVRARAGDVLRLVRARDLDRDGITDIEEALYGSSDEDLDSDNDGFSDYWEVREGWAVNPRDQATRRVQPAPTLADSDFDGLSDMEEFERGLHPVNPDTDSDGLLDPADPRPLSFDNLSLPEYYADLDECSREGCFNSDPNTPANTFQLYWNYPLPTDDLPLIEEVLVLREIIPTSDPDLYEPFIASTLRTEGDLATALIARNVRAIYRGSGTRYEDQFLAPHHQHIYHFYSVYQNAVGTRAYIYSGSDGAVFSPNYPATPLIEVGVFTPTRVEIYDHRPGDDVRIFGTMSAQIGPNNFFDFSQDPRFTWWNFGSSQAVNIGQPTPTAAAIFWPGVYHVPGSGYPQSGLGLSADYGLIFVCLNEGETFTVRQNYRDRFDDGSGTAEFNASVGINYNSASSSGQASVPVNNSSGNPVGSFFYNWTHIGAFNIQEARERCNFFN